MQLIDRIIGKLLVKLVDNFFKNEIEDNVLNNIKQLRFDIVSSNNSFFLRIVKWQGYGRIFSEDNYILLKIGVGFLNRQIFLDFVIVL